MSKLLFIGAGKMASAIAGGIVKANVFSAAELAAFDVSPQAAASFTAATQVSCVPEVKQALAEAEKVLIAVKPQYLESALAPLKGCFADKLIISIVAGVTLESLSALTGSKRIIRVMPNTPALVGKGAAAFSGGEGTSEADLAFASEVFNAAGIGLQVPEKLLDAVTGLSGSGPAYVFEFIQALADGGVAEGLPRDTALQLAAQTVLGAAAMVLETGVHPAVLKDQVTSPGGTTIRGLEKLAERGFAGTVLQAVRTASARSAELGKK
jgi:pyrroline-5-carboxylate reductase